MNCPSIILNNTHSSTFPHFIEWLFCHSVCLSSLFTIDAHELLGCFVFFQVLDVRCFTTFGSHDTSSSFGQAFRCRIELHKGYKVFSLHFCSVDLCFLYCFFFFQTISATAAFWVGIDIPNTFGMML